MIWISRSLRAPRGHFLVGLALGALLVGGVTYAAVPDSATGKVTACYATSGVSKGVLRVIDYQAGQRCASGQAMISWASRGLRYRGAWAVGGKYAPDDVVTRSGASYVAAAATATAVPPASPWRLLAAAGAPGAKGNPGVQGPAGPKGDPGVSGAKYGRPIITTTVVDSSAVTGKWTSITTGTDGNPVVAYFNSTTATNRIAVCANPVCTGSTITTTDAGTQRGENPSLTIGADGSPALVYFDRLNSTLNFGQCANPTCVGANTHLGMASGVQGLPGPSIVINPASNPEFSFYASGANAVLLEICGDPTCNVAPVTSRVLHSGFAAYTSTAVNASGNTLVSYSDGASLHVVSCADAACTTSTDHAVDINNGLVGDYGSMTIGADGNPVISYYDVSNGNLKVAHCVDATCTAPAVLTAVDQTGNVGTWTSITLDTDGFPLISYYDLTNTAVKLADCGDAACTTASVITVDDSAAVGEYSSITINGDGNAVISYFDATNGRLKVSAVSHSNWHPGGGWGR